MKIYNNLITIKKNEIESLKEILGVSRISTSEIRRNKLKRKIKSIYISSEVKGKYRLRSYKRIYFDKNYNEDPSIVEIKEGGVSLKFDLKKVYYDNTYANERALFLNQIGNRSAKKEISIDVLYGGIGVLGFYLLRCPLIKNTTIVDYNPSCKKWFEESKELQPKKHKNRINFVESKVRDYLKITNNKIAVCIAPLNRIPLVALIRTYEEVYFYILLAKLEVDNYAKSLTSRKVRLTYRVAKEYSSSSIIYLFHLIRSI